MCSQFKGVWCEILGILYFVWGTFINEFYIMVNHIFQFLKIFWQRWDVNFIFNVILREQIRMQQVRRSETSTSKPLSKYFVIQKFSCYSSVAVHYFIEKLVFLWSLPSWGTDQFHSLSKYTIPFVVFSTTKNGP